MRNETFLKKVDGMICPQCEDEIAERLIHTRGVLSCAASYRRSEVRIDFDPDMISAGEIEKILSNAGYPVGNGRSGLRSDLAGIAAIVILYFALPCFTELVKVPQAEAGAGFGALFLIGILTGVHCIGMCGGIMLTTKNAFAYNIGRLLSYTVVGAVFGAIGTIITYDIRFKSMLFTLCGVLVVIIGLMMWGVPFLRRISPELIKPCRFKGGRPLAIGLLTGLMPCGALTAMWIFAASSGSATKGAESMFAFGLGTCVFMLVFGLFGVFIPKKYHKYILKVSTVLIVALGLILMTKGITLLGII